MRFRLLILLRRDVFGAIKRAGGVGLFDDDGKSIFPAGAQLHEKPFRLNLIGVNTVGAARQLFEVIINFVVVAVVFCFLVFVAVVFCFLFFVFCCCYCCCYCYCYCYCFNCFCCCCFFPFKKQSIHTYISLV